MAIQVEFVADVSKFIRGTGDVDNALDKVANSLDDTARDGDRSVDRLADSFKAMADQARSAAKKAGDSLDREIRGGAKKADDGISTLKDNTASNAKEMGGSFTDVSSALGAIQGLAAEALEGFGPAGMAAGVAAAIGIGLLTVALEQASEAGNELTVSASELATGLGEGGAASDAALLNSRFQEMLTSLSDVKSVWELWQPRGVTNAESFAEALDASALSAETLNDAFKDPDPVIRLQNLESALADVNHALALADTMSSGNLGAAQTVAAWTDAELAAAEAALEHQGALEETRKALEKYRDEEQAAQAITEAMATAQGLSVDQFLLKQEALADTAQAEEAYGDALLALADPVSVYEGIIDRKNAADDASKVSTQDLIDEWNRQADRAADFERNLAEIARAGGQALADELRAQGPSAAAATAEMLADADPRLLDDAIRAHARATGESVQTNFAQGIGNNRGAPLNQFRQTMDDLRGTAAPGITVPVYVDKSSAENAIAALRRQANSPLTFRAGFYQTVGQSRP